MTKKMIAFSLLASTLFIACQQDKKCCKENKKEKTENVESQPTEMVIQSFTNKEGQTLTLEFNNTKNTVVLDWMGEKSELKGQKAASGFWYTNEIFDLSGKGNDILLKKGDEIIFEHEDQIEHSEAKNEKGEKLTLTFNHTAKTAKVYVNGGKEINLTKNNEAKETTYQNSEYTLLVQNGHYTLTKGDQVLFAN